MTITTYTSLKTATAEWLDRAGETALTDRFDDFLALTEQRMYFGKEGVQSLGLPECEPLRIRQMETANAAFALTDGVAQPTGFLEIIEATLNSPLSPLDIIQESIIDGHADTGSGDLREIALSGTNFRCYPTGGSGTITLRYFAKLDTPSGTTATNWVLTNTPGVYLNGCIAEAALHGGDREAAALHLALYAADVASLNKRRNMELSRAHNVHIRMRGWTP